MAFIHKRLEQIAQTVNLRLLGNRASDSEEDEDNQRRDREMPLMDKMEMWSDRGETSDALDIEDDATSDQDIGLPSPLKNDDFVLRLERSNSFIWLRENIKNLFGLTEGRVRDEIRNCITALQPEEIHISREARPSPFRIMLDLDWDLLSFIESEAAGIRRRGAKNDEIISLANIERTITITGSATNAQSLTCEEYLHLVWPTIGSSVLNSLKHTAQGSIAGSHIYTPGSLPGIDNLAFKVGKTLNADISGEIHAVAEVCEVLVWLAAALRKSNESGQLSGCHPSFAVNGGPSSASAKVHFTEKKLGRRKNGQCWYPMFNNPVVVEGFPIIRRTNSDTGLETTLKIISAVLRTQQVTILNGKLYIKAFSSMLIPVAQTGDLIVWHYVYDKGGDYLWYHENSVKHINTVNTQMLEQYRHVIGWTSDVKVMAGLPDSCLDVKKSGLKKPPSAVALKGFSISVGRWGLNATGTVTVGNKDPALRVSSTDSIDQKLDWVRQRNIVIWDAQQRKGWLLDGATVLLYMFRVFLNYWSHGPMKSSLKLKKGFKEPDYSTTRFPQAALDFFRDEDSDGSDSTRNLDLPTFRKKVEHCEEKIDGREPQVKMTTTYHTVQDRVEELLEVLLQAIELQYRLAEREGIYWSGHLAKHLEGWDFFDFATQQHHFDPITQSMACRSLPWVSFIRSIKAVTLFGRGFGEVFVPSGKNCQRWSKLPHGENYLAVPTERLLHIIRSFNGSPTSNPIKLSVDYIWRGTSPNYNPCCCTSSNLANLTNHQNIADNVETIHPITVFTDIRETGQRCLPHGHGAVVFGKNPAFKWYCNDEGETQKGDDPSSPIGASSDEEDAQIEILNSGSPSLAGTGTLGAETDTEPTSQTVESFMVQTADIDTAQSSDRASSNQRESSRHKKNPLNILRNPKEGVKSLMERVRNRSIK